MQGYGNIEPTTRYFYLFSPLLSYSLFTLYRVQFQFTGHSLDLSDNVLHDWLFPHHQCVHVHVHVDRHTVTCICKYYVHVHVHLYMYMYILYFAINRIELIELSTRTKFCYKKRSSHSYIHVLPYLVVYVHVHIPDFIYCCIY